MKDPAAAEWLDKFSREYYQASFRKDGDNLHSDEQRRQCYQANNERGRDMWTQMQRLPNDRSDYIADTVPPTVDEKSAGEDAGPEDSIIEAIDKDE